MLGLVAIVCDSMPGKTFKVVTLEGSLFVLNTKSDSGAHMSWTKTPTCLAELASIIAPDYFTTDTSKRAFLRQTLGFRTQPIKDRKKRF